MGFRFGIHGKKGIFTVSDRPTKGPAVLGKMHMGLREGSRGPQNHTVIPSE